MDNENPLDQLIKNHISDYLLWMISKDYAEHTITKYERGLNHYKTFILRNKIKWEDVFTYDTFIAFQKKVAFSYTPIPVKGLAKYLFKQNIIPSPIKKTIRALPEIFEKYIKYYTRVNDASHHQILCIRRGLTAFNAYLDKNGIELKSIRIKKIDAFLAEYNKGFAQITSGNNRSILRGYLTYLYQNKIIKRNLAPLVIGATIFAQSKPPKHLRLDEIKKLFENVTGSTPKALRTKAMVHLGFYFGLRPKEISSITLDDIEFKKGELRVPNRKNTKSAKLPLSEKTIKAIAAYIIGARPQTDSRRLFLTFHVPCRPILPVTVSKDIADAMKKAGLESTAYWLRHTYAQNLLEAEVQIFEVKEMMGHDNINTTRRYLNIHTKLMSEVLFDE